MEKEYLVNEYEEGVLFQDGKFVKVLAAGKHLLGKHELDKKEEVRKLERELGIRELTYSLPALLGLMPQSARRKTIDLKKRIEDARRDPRIEVKCVDTREQTLQIPGQEMITSDKGMVKLNLLARFRVTDAEKAVLETDNYKDMVHQEVQMAVRKHVRKATLEELLAGKEDIGSAINADVVKRLKRFGIELGSISLKDIILPPKVKAAMNRVVEAEREGKAKLISAREEVAAARALANAATLIAGNPNILKLRQIEVLRDIAQSGANVHVTLGDGPSAAKKRGK